MVQIVKDMPAMQETQVWSLDQEDTTEKGMATKGTIWNVRHSASPSVTWAATLFFPGHQDYAACLFLEHALLISGEGCHFLLQCMKVKSEREVAQSCPTLCDPMDCSLPGSSVHGIFQARVLEWGAIAFYASHQFDSKRYMHPSVHCGTIYNNQDMGAI